VSHPRRHAAGRRLKRILEPTWARKAVAENAASSRLRQGRAGRHVADRQFATSSIARGWPSTCGGGRDMAPNSDWRAAATRQCSCSRRPPGLCARSEGRATQQLPALASLPLLTRPGSDASGYTQLMFAQHAAISRPGGRNQGHRGIPASPLQCGGGTVASTRSTGADGQMNAHLFLFGPTGSANRPRCQQHPQQPRRDLPAPRLFIVEAGTASVCWVNSPSAWPEWHRVKLAPGDGREPRRPLRCRCVW